jgi:hypothetical protein
MQRRFGCEVCRDARRHLSYAPDHPRVIEATPLCWEEDLAPRRAASSGVAQWASAQFAFWTYANLMANRVCLQQTNSLPE